VSRLSPQDQVLELNKTAHFASVLESKNAPHILQINVGKWCNQTCKHCHVDAGPLKKEAMSMEIAQQCLKILEENPSLTTLDLTGGAPEGHEVFKTLVLGAKKLNRTVLDRCNLTILTQPGYEWLLDFLYENQVQIVASLPHFSASRTNSQRGNGVFEHSIEGLKMLNSKGYGIQSELSLHLVYNPSGAFLSGNQSELEREFKEQLKRRYDIDFTGLYALNNLPVSRFLESLLRADKLNEYMDLLVSEFNPSTLSGLMCLQQISVSYDGNIYDCDFNQMLELNSEDSPNVFNLDLKKFSTRKIKTSAHCFGCTAGSGSSCGGSLTE
jgi:radical SAM/Cys-rich protein